MSDDNENEDPVAAEEGEEPEQEPQEEEAEEETGGDDDDAGDEDDGDDDEKKPKKEKIAAKDRAEYIEADEDDDIFVLVREFLQSKAWTCVVMTSTFYALFQVDLGAYFFSKRADAPLAFVTFGVFIVFAFEMTLNFVLKIDYGVIEGWKKLIAFYFWLDLIGTVSLVPDFLVIFGLEFPAPSTLILARIARVARVGARLTRLMKIFRSKGGKSQYAKLMLSDDEKQLEDSAASTFGEEVSDGISKRVVLLTLILLITVPLFSPHPTPSKQSALDLAAKFDKEHLKRTFQVNDGALQKYLHFEGGQVVKMRLYDEPGDKCKKYKQPPAVKGLGYYAKLDALENSQYYDKPYAECFGADHEVRWMCPEACNIGLHAFVDWEDDMSMRMNELLAVDSSDGTIKTMIYIRTLKRYDAYMTMMYMFFNILVFGSATSAFLNQIFELVINPMERICGALQNLAKSMKQLSAGLDDDSDEFEMLSNSILKLTGMLKTSLGDAGASIIAKNIDAADDSINPMIPGTKMNGYFCFCDVRKFGAVMRVLDNDIMIFTNEICHHVHESISNHMGMPNKNIGDSWLSVWTQKEEAIYSKSSTDKKTFADHAVQSCLDIIDALKTNPAIIEMCARPEFKDEPTFEGEDYEVSMGFGLHYGWAIEGAVGSKYKVDATYLSPNVNLSARLEAATKQYGVDILVTEEFYSRMSPEWQVQMYRIDRVLVVGSSWPTIMYGYEKYDDEGNSSIGKKTRYAYEHDMATTAYIAGDWADARKNLQSCLAERPDAKSPQVLLDFMSNYGGGTGGLHAPGDWAGHRRLSAK